MKQRMRYTAKLALLVSLLASAPSWAAWHLDSTQSRLGFVSIKQGNVAETHQFLTLTGQVNAQQQVCVSIDLARVDTKIPLRDERMRELLFKTASYPLAIIQAQLPPALLTDLAVGSTQHQVLNAELNLHGVKKNLELSLTVSRLSADRLLVVNDAPLVVQAGDFKLADGVETLRGLAKLDSISHAVPVNFVLNFQDGADSVATPLAGCW